VPGTECSIINSRDTDDDTSRLTKIRCFWNVYLNWRRLEMIRQLDKTTISNEEVSRKVNDWRYLLQCKHWRIDRVLLRHEQLQEIVEKRMKGKSSRGSRQLQLLNDMMKGWDYTAIKRTDRDRNSWSTGYCRWWTMTMTV